MTSGREASLPHFQPGGKARSASAPGLLQITTGGSSPLEQFSWEFFKGHEQVLVSARFFRIDRQDHVIFRLRLVKMLDDTD